MSIAQHIELVQQRIITAANKFNKDPTNITLLAVSKQQNTEKIRQAMAAGLWNFGENYLQEALVKMADLKNTDIIWHFIGKIQSNKTREIAEHFSWVHTVTSEKIARRLSQQRPADLPPLNICIEINISHESSKAGIELAALETLAKYITQFPNLRLRGLMVIPEATDDFEQQRIVFNKTYAALQNLRNLGFAVDTLSMGMSNDLEAAIAEGATIVRIGTAIFGKRGE